MRGGISLELQKFPQPRCNGPYSYCADADACREAYVWQFMTLPVLELKVIHLQFNDNVRKAWLAVDDQHSGQLHIMAMEL